MEILDIFFKKYKIRPNFINWYHNAQNASFEIYHGDWWCEPDMPWYCTPPYDYVPWFIFTRFPRELSKMTALLRICTPVVWMLIFLSLFSVCAFFNLNFYVGKKIGLKFRHEEIVLCPFRFKYKKKNHITLFTFLGSWCPCRCHRKHLKDFLEVLCLVSGASLEGLFFTL